MIYAPEPTGRHLIGAGDPALFNVLDTALRRDRDLFPAQSPLLANLRVDVALSVKRNTWVRNREANVEIYTDDPVTIHDEQQAFALTGVVTTDRGEYNFLSKRFQIKRGSAMFIGSPDLNPTLQITGEYQVEVASRGALNIRVVDRRNAASVRSSRSRATRSRRSTQSELLSLLAFGQSTTSLLAFGVVEHRRLRGDERLVRRRRAAGGAPSGGRGARRGGRSDRAAGRPRVRHRRLRHHAGRRADGARRTRHRELLHADEDRGGQVHQPADVRERAGAGGAASAARIEHRTADGWRFNASDRAAAFCCWSRRSNSQPSSDGAVVRRVHHSRVEVLARSAGAPAADYVNSSHSAAIARMPLK